VEGLPPQDLELADLLAPLTKKNLLRWG
jgi:hypothetical protein